MPSLPLSRDPWLVGGCVLLVFLSGAVLALYRWAPQSVNQARNQVRVIAAPSSQEGWLASAHERLASATAAAAQGQDSLAEVNFEAAARHATRAIELASTAAERQDAVDLWADALLLRAELLQRNGAKPGIRPDDQAMLQGALDLVRRAATASPSPHLLRRARSMEDEIRRQLRPAPLEWLPSPR